MERQDKKHILFVITQGHWGGAQKYLFDLILGLSSQYTITLAIGEKGINSDLGKKLSKHVRIHSLNHLKRNISPFHDIFAIHELKQLYASLQPDLIHLNSSKAGVLGSLAGKRISIPILYTAHGWVFTEPLPHWKKMAYKQLEKRTATLKKAIICLSEEDKHIAKRQGIQEKKLHVIPLGIDIPTFLNKTEAKKHLLEHPTDKFIFGTIANHYKTKGLDILLQAFAQYKKTSSHSKLILIGDGPEKNKLQKLTNELALSNDVIFAGYKKNAAQYLKAFDVFVLPSRKEGLPYVIQEAKAAQLPIIAAQVGGVQSLLPNKTDGIIVPPDNVDALVQAMKSISSMNFSPTEPHSLNSMVCSTQLLFEQSLNSKSV